MRINLLTATIMALLCLGSIGTSWVAAQGAAQGGGGTGAANGLEFGSGIEAGLSDPDSVFEIDRGNNVGASSATVSGFSNVGGAGGATGGGAGGFGGGGFGGGMGGLGGLGGLFGGAFNQAQGQQDTSKTIRTRLRSAVEFRPIPSAQLQSTLRGRLDRNVASERFQGATVSFEDGMARLSGTVASEKDARMARLLMKLEPGVRDVQDDLQVADTLPNPSTIPTTNLPVRGPREGRVAPGMPSFVDQNGWRPLSNSE